MQQRDDPDRALREMRAAVESGSGVYEIPSAQSASVLAGCCQCASLLTLADAG